MPEQPILFDFDGTIVRGDTFLAFVLAGLRARPARLPATVATLGVVGGLLLHPRTTTAALTAMVWSATRGRTRAELEADMDQFVVARQAEGPWLYTDAAERIRQHRARSERVVVVTGCEQSLAERVCAAYGLGALEVVGSGLAERAGSHVLAPHCYNARKLQCLGAHGIRPPFRHVYTDSALDLPIVRAAARATLVNPSARTLKRVRSGCVTPFEVARWT